MLDYIVKDLERARITTGDFDIGGMVVCDSATQAREMNNIFQKKYILNDKPAEKKDFKTAQDNFFR